MKKIIVTGATGFIGGNLVCELLENNYEVGILCRNISNFKMLDTVKNRIKIYNVEDSLSKIINAFQDFKPEYIIHLASFFKAEHCKDDIENLLDTNIKYSTKILEAMNQCGIKNIINTGTAWQHYNNEDYNPVCLYSATKEAFEKIIDYYVKALNFKCITLELFDSYGKNDNRGKLISLLKDFAINNKKIYMSKGEPKIDLTHVDDITNAFIKALEYLDFIGFGDHRKYAVCTERLLSLKEVIEIFEEKTGYKLNVDWGARKYRFREVMTPWNGYELLPNWSSKISFEEGIMMIYK